MPSLSIAELKKRIARFPRQSLIQAPTPLYRMENLSRALNGPEIFVKREDLTGLAFGGNKSRKLEFIIQDVLDQRADVVVTWGSLQSNWCLQTAAAARRYGIRPVLILFKSDDSPTVYDGNLLLDFILEADIRIRKAQKGKVVRREMVEQEVEAIVSELKDKGHHPYVAPLGGSAVSGSMRRPLGAIGYAGACVEMAEQAAALGFEADYVVHSSGSGGTQGGLVAGARALGDRTKVLGISVSDDRISYGREVLAIARDTANALELDLALSEEDVIIFDQYIGEGYGIVDREVSEAVRFVAVTEGIFLDPVYTGRTMNALIDLAKQGFFKREDKVVFLHTGGTAALFPYRDRMTRFLAEHPA
jgi:D-cysteine desulfhydrase family pyridoxal phosphate-dependent enzyme